MDLQLITRDRLSSLSACVMISNQICMISITFTARFTNEHC